MIGLTRDPKHRYRWNDGPLVPGVTTVQGMKDKSGPLVGWAKREVAACAVRNIDMLHQMVQTGGPESALTWLKALPDYQRDSSADVGTRVHAALEAIALGVEPVVDDDVAPFVASWRRDFLDAFRPDFRAVEFMVYSERYQYGGTGDVAAVIERPRADRLYLTEGPGADLWMLDYKSGTGIYPDTGLQLAALRWADWVGLPGDPKKYAVPQATRFGVVHVRPEATVFREYRVTSEEFDAFLACRRLYRWVNEVSPRVMGETLREAA